MQDLYVPRNRIKGNAYLVSSTGALSGTATYQPTYGQITSSNKSGFLYTPRQIEIAARFRSKKS
jgi:hypothetical protein